MNRVPLRAAGVLALGALVLGGCAAPTASAPGPGGTPAPPTITARGVGTASATPDTATLVLAVQERHPSAGAALGAAGAGATALLATLDQAGIAAADRRTSGLTVNPAFDHDGRASGYEATTEITATIRDTGAVGGLLDAAGEATGDALRVRAVTFAVDDDSEPRARARTDAVHQAQARARQLAEAAGVDLGVVRTISEVVADPVTPYAADAARAAVPVEVGSQELTAVVEITYAIDG
ncbi:SIMPL domain-containing protein [Pseudonocardia lacus]|uniref:SIMPL domain-containing protein n=1 Tax=Pseudonocardia lacus TaxID=2835865 RepID=UPI001BDDA333|nr:SIMPL domain-containing protein [Pseudonocardia lacus]